jgi:hypothetical protein
VARRARFRQKIGFSTKESVRTPSLLTAAHALQQLIPGDAARNSSNPSSSGAAWVRAESNPLAWIVALSVLSMLQSCGTSSVRHFASSNVGSSASPRSNFRLSMAGLAFASLARFKLESGSTALPDIGPYEAP